MHFTLRSLHPRFNNPGIHWIVGWVGLRAGLDVAAKRNILPLPGIETNIIGIRAVVSDMNHTDEQA
jgi:hypothetical protein